MPYTNRGSGRRVTSLAEELSAKQNKTDLDSVSESIRRSVGSVLGEGLNDLRNSYAAYRPSVHGSQEVRHDGISSQRGQGLSLFHGGKQKADESHPEGETKAMNKAFDLRGLLVRLAQNATQRPHTRARKDRTENHTDAGNEPRRMN